MPRMLCTRTAETDCCVQKKTTVRNELLELVSNAVASNHCQLTYAHDRRNEIIGAACHAPPGEGTKLPEVRSQPKIWRYNTDVFYSRGSRTWLLLHRGMSVTGHRRNDGWLVVGYD